MKRPILFITLLLLLLNGCSKEIKFTCGISESSQVGINHVRPVVEAMEKYKIDNGKYPENALKLIPKYLDKIPIVINTNENLDDESRYEILKQEKIRGGVPWIANGGNYYEIKFYSKDDRICLLSGRNNICEYSSDRPVWNCHQ